MDSTQSEQPYKTVPEDGPNNAGSQLTAAGIDAGGTLVKIAYIADGVRRYRKFRSDRLAEAADWIRHTLADAPVCLTGGKAARLAGLLGMEAGQLPEFTATVRGIRDLLSASSGGDPGAFLLTNVGTGTSIHYVDAERSFRVGGTGVGGGTIVGLGRLLAGMNEFEQIVAEAAGGDRASADLKVRHIYEGAQPPIDGDLTASNFGNVPPVAAGEASAVSRSDALASVIGLVGETVATVSVQAAGRHGLKTVVYIGSSFNANRPLRDAVESYTRFRGGEPLFVENGEYSGAIGALLEVTSRISQGCSAVK